MTWPIVAFTAILIVTAGALLVIGLSRRAIGRAFVVLGLVLARVFLWIALGISYLVGRTPAWLATLGTWIATAAAGVWLAMGIVARILFWATLILLTLGIILTIVLVALFITGQYDAMAVIFLVLATLTLPFCIFFSWVKSWFGLRRARLLLALFTLFLFNATLSLAMGSFAELFSHRAFYMLTGIALVIAPLLAWWWGGRTILILAMFPLVWFALLAENRPLLASIRGWFEAESEYRTVANNLEIARVQEQATKVALDAAETQTKAEMTLALVKKDTVLLELKNPLTGNLLPIPSAPLEKGDIIAFTKARPEIQMRYAPEIMVEAIVKDTRGLYTPLSPYKGLVAMRLIRQMGPYLDPPLEKLELADDRKFPIPDQVTSDRRLSLGYDVQVGDWLVFPDIDPPPAKGVLQMVIGTQTTDLSTYRHIEVEENGRPIFICRQGNSIDTFTVFVQHYVPKGDSRARAAKPEALLAATEAARKEEKRVVVKFFNDTHSDPISVYQILPGAPAGQDRHLLAQLGKGYGWWQSAGPNDIFVVENSTGWELGRYEKITAQAIYKF